MEKMENFDEFVNEAKLMDNIKSIYNNIKSKFTDKPNMADFSIDYEKLANNIIDNPKKATILKTHKEISGLATHPSLWRGNIYSATDFKQVITYVNRYKRLEDCIGILKNFTKQNPALLNDKKTLDALKVWQAHWDNEIEEYQSLK